MPNQSLIASTNWPEMLFGGALPPNYATPLDRPRFNVAEPSDIDWQVLLPPIGVQWQLSNATADGKIRFHTTLDITGQVPAEVRFNAFCKLVCIYLVSHLNQESLIEACESLRDIYTWQSEKAEIIVHERQPEYLGTFTSDQLGRQPLSHRDR